MAEKNTVHAGAHRVVADAAVDEQRQSWVQVLVTGEKMRNGGKTFTITRADLDAYAADLAGRAGRVPLDYDHSFAERGDSRAAGWFTGQTEIRQGETAELWAEVEWTAAAVEAIRSGEYRYLSPEISFQTSKDGVLQKAKQFLAAALTNRPFFENMAAVTLTVDEQLAEVAAALDLDDAAVAWLAQWTAAQINDLPDSSFLHIEPGGEKDSGGKTTPRSLRHFPVKDADGNVDLPHVRNALARIPQSSLPANVKERAQAAARRLLTSNGGSTATNRQGGTMPDFTVIAKELGLADDATDEQVLAAIKERNEKAAKTDELEQQIAAAAAEGDRVAKLETDLAAERTKRIDGERDVMLARAVEERRIVPAQKDVLTEQFGENLDGLAKFLDASPKGTFAEKGAAGGNSNSGAAAAVSEAPLYEVKSENGQVIANVVDDEWLNARASEILAEKQKTVRAASPAEYMAALEQAQNEALSVTGR